MKQISPKTQQCGQFDEAFRTLERKQKIIADCGLTRERKTEQPKQSR